MRTLLQSLSKENIIEFLVEYAESDTNFANAVNVRFVKPDFSTELQKIKRYIEHAFRGIEEKYYRNGWGYLHVDTSKIDSEIDERVKQGHFRLAFAECSLLYKKYLEIFEYQEECEIADKAEYTLATMDNIANKVTDSEDGNYIFNTCIALCAVESGKDYGTDYEEQLLRIASTFVTEENAAELLAAVERYCSDWRAESSRLIQLEIIEKVKGREAADAFINENLQYGKIREMAYEKALAQADYELAEALCTDKISEEAPQPYKSNLLPWLNKLYAVHEAAHNIEKMSETAEKILLSGGDLKYYDILKSLLEKQNLWDESYLALRDRCKKALNYVNYAKILFKEEEYALLFELAKSHTDLVYEYGTLFCEHFRQETLELFLTVLNQEAKMATGRTMYQFVCRRISTFKSAGYVAEANELIENLKLTYKRKPAFVDELTRCTL